MVRGQLQQLAAGNLGLAEALGPQRHEVRPLLLVGVADLGLLVAVLEEAANTSRPQDTPDHRRPALEAPQADLTPGASLGDPGSHQGEQGRHQAGPLGLDPAQQVAVAEPLPEPGPLHGGVQPDADAPPRQLAGQDGVVAGAHPQRPVGQVDHARLPQQAIRPDLAGEHRGHALGVQGVLQVVDQHQAGGVHQGRGELLADLLLVVRKGRAPRGRARGDDGHHVGEQGLAGALGRSFHQVQRGEAAHEVTGGGQQQGGQGVGAVALPGEGEVPQQIVTQEREGLCALLGAGDGGACGGRGQDWIRDGLVEVGAHVVALALGQAAVASDQGQMHDALEHGQVVVREGEHVAHDVQGQAGGSRAMLRGGDPGRGPVEQRRQQALIEGLEWGQPRALILFADGVDQGLTVAEDAALILRGHQCNPGVLHDVAELAAVGHDLWGSVGVEVMVLGRQGDQGLLLGQLREAFGEPRGHRAQLVVGGPVQTGPELVQRRVQRACCEGVRQQIDHPGEGLPAASLLDDLPELDFVPGHQEIVGPGLGHAGKPRELHHAHRGALPGQGCAQALTGQGHALLRGAVGVEADVDLAASPGPAPEHGVERLGTRSLAASWVREHVDAREPDGREAHLGEGQGLLLPLGDEHGLAAVLAEQAHALGDVRVEGEALLQTAPERVLVLHPLASDSIPVHTQSGVGMRLAIHNDLGVRVGEGDPGDTACEAEPSSLSWSHRRDASLLDGRVRQPGGLQVLTVLRPQPGQRRAVLVDGHGEAHGRASPCCALGAPAWWASEGTTSHSSSSPSPRR